MDKAMNLITTLGCDPECFLYDPIHNKFISSIGLIGGTKENARPIDANGNGVLEDNVAVEFNTPPCKTVDEFKSNIKFNLEYIRARAKELGYEVAIKPSARFDDDQLATPQAQEFGCEPDFNAWLGGQQNPRPCASDGNLRSCGGHVHIALDYGQDCLEVIKAMDLFVGCLMLEFDNDEERRELYGKAGSFRKKSYGVEYRTASNAWIESDERIQWVWDQTDKALEFVMQGRSFTYEQGQRVQECINTSNMDLLAELKQEFNL
jgi:hypothetical protein